MPEGDTIHRTALALRRALVGRALTRVELRRLPPPLPKLGSTVEAVEARGKHLLVRSSDGLTIHTHQRMTGSWHLYRPGEAWHRSVASARVVLGVPGVVAVCFAAPVVEVLDDRGLRRHPSLSSLGPDLCEPNADLDDAVGRMARFVGQDRTIGEALLDQRIAAGIGNVYRCEVLFLHGIDPATPATQLDAATRRALLATAGTLLRANLGNAPRTTADGPDGSLWVYGRAGLPCRRCGATIVRERWGEPPRVVDRCPTCQPRATFPSPAHADR